MSYILFLIFKSNKFKKDPTVRLNINNFFVDEFEIPSNTVKQTETWGTLLFKNSIKKNMEFLKNYKFSLSDKKQLSDFFPKDLQDTTFLEKIVNLSNTYTHAVELSPNTINNDYQNNKEIINQIKISIKNSDNNYTNGFMTKSTLVSLKGVFLIPKSICENGFDFFKSYLNHRHNLKKNCIAIKDIKKYYVRSRTPFEFTFIPNEKQFDYNHNFSISLKNSQGQEIIQETLSYFGGDGTYTITWKTNKEQKLSDQLVQFSLHYMYLILNKYIQHENLRNNN
tara:strand:+ start:284 stop:1126 length:843 start_codon:yes stop_codon:yes gene_type:complete